MSLSGVNCQSVNTRALCLIGGEKLEMNKQSETTIVLVKLKVKVAIWVFSGYVFLSINAICHCIICI